MGRLLYNWMIIDSVLSEIGSLRVSFRRNRPEIFLKKLKGDFGQYGILDCNTSAIIWVPIALKATRTADDYGGGLFIKDKSLYYDVTSSYILTFHFKIRFLVGRKKEYI